MKNKYFSAIIGIFILSQFSMLNKLNAQGVWTPVATVAPDTGGGGMLLLSDGSVIVKTSAGGGDGIGNTWNKLTPDIHGSYINGTWSTIAPMNGTRLYFSTQTLKSGKVYVAGGEYGTGETGSEIYDPVADVWSEIPLTGDTFADANSNLLPDGRILQQLAMGNFLGNAIFDPVTLTYTPTGNCLSYPSESAWLQLPDYSILFDGFNNRNSERYIPSLGKWVTDAKVPDSLWSHYETGGSLLLPNGQAFFTGAGGHTAFYKPSGTTAPGVWTAGPDIPNLNGTVDAPAAMMANGKVLYTVAPKPYNDSTGLFNAPTSFYEFDYLTKTFTQIAAPAGLDTDQPTYIYNMLDLPDGSVMLSSLVSSQYYIYTPGGTPTVSGKPVINTISTTDCNTYTITGKVFNGISQGSTYNDDFQPFTNFPIVRLTSGNNVYYARTYNWNRVGVVTDSLEDTTQFILPAGLPVGTYSLTVSANGISSSPITVVTCPVGIDEIVNNTNVSVYPNPGNGIFTVKSSVNQPSLIEIYNMLGEKILSMHNSQLSTVNYQFSINISNEPSGIYLYRVISERSGLIGSGKLVIQ